MTEPERDDQFGALTIGSPSSYPLRKAYVGGTGQHRQASSILQGQGSSAGGGPGGLRFFGGAAGRVEEDSCADQACGQAPEPLAFTNSFAASSDRTPHQQPQFG